MNAVPSCAYCGAVVDSSNAATHETWHNVLNELLDKLVAATLVADINRGRADQ
jgi:hypothetical protein